MAKYPSVEEYNHSQLCFNIHVDVEHATFGHLVSDVTVCALDLALMVIAVVANVLAIAAYRRSSVLQTPSNYLLMILSTVDLVFALTVQPLFFVWKALELSGRFSCEVYLSTVLLINFLGAVSFLITSFLISLERYFSVFYPLFHRKNANKRVFKLALLVVSISWLAFLLVMFLNEYHRVYFVVAASVVALCLAATILCYRNIFREMSRRCGDRMASVESITDERRQAGGRLKREKATLMNMVFIVGAMTLLYAPIGGCVVYAILIGRDWLYMNFFVPWAYQLVFISNAMHPFLYGWRSRGMRRSINGVIRSVFEETDV
jgi:hypothetical protein